MHIYEKNTFTKNRLVAPKKNFQKKKNIGTRPKIPYNTSKILIIFCSFIKTLFSKSHLYRDLDLCNLWLLAPYLFYIYA